MSGGTKNLAVMGMSMMLVRRLDQEDPDVLTYTRVFFATYVLIGLLVNLLLHSRVIKARDLTIIRVPVATSPFALPTPPSDDDASAAGPATPAAEQPAEKESTVMAYDLSALAQTRRSWMLNAAILTIIHMKSASVSPLIMSSVMGLMRFLDEPLFKLHVLGHPSVGSLRRPFKPEPNPLAAMMQSVAAAQQAADPAATEQGARAGLPHPVSTPAVVEELHDDEEEDEEGEEEEPRVPIVEDIDGDDFADDDANGEPKKSK